MNRKILTPDQRLRIFISSTLVELKEERARIIKAIKDLKLIPVFFESGAHPHPPSKWYRSNLQQSHIYVGIFDRSYGCVAPNMEISGIEDEYILAKERKLPRFVYVKNTNEERDKRLEALLERIKKDGDICYKPFDKTDELGELVQNDIAILLAERFGIGEGAQRPQLQSNYLKQIEEDMKRYGYIDRSNIVSDILKNIEAEKRILLLGEPGIGKTFLLGKIGLMVDAIYISLLNKTPLQVFTYLTNHLRMKQDRTLEVFTSEDDAKVDFEISLEDSESIMLIDHADQNPTLAHTLFSISFYRNKVVFAVRSETVLNNYMLPVFRVDSFTRNEIEQYLEFKRIQLGISEFTRLLRASRGNPLYLFYFTNFQIEPLPEGLDAYQKALWRTLSTFDRELLGVISLSLFPPSLEVISQVASRLSNRMLSGMEIADALSAISSLLQIYQGHYKIFHPYFKEHIIEALKGLGLAKSYHLVLGEVNQSDNNPVNTAFHFLRADDKRAEDYLLEASQTAFLWGLWDLTEEFLIRYLEINSASNNIWNQGYAHYQLCWFYRERGKLQKAKYHYEKALDGFENCGDNDWFWLTKIWQYLEWISEGNGKDAVESLEKLLEKYEGVDNLKEAQVLVNLSFAYIQLSQAEKGANTAKRAYEIFAEYEDYNGLIMSLTNLTSCLGQLEEYKLVKEYAEKMIMLARTHHHQRFLAAGLNHLALAQRKLRDPDGAQKSLEEAIEICQNLGAVESEIMNILNLGNVYNDKNDYERAIRIYQNALVKAKASAIKREEGRALELIAGIKRLQKDFDSTIELATKAINIQEELGNSLSIIQYFIRKMR